MFPPAATHDIRPQVDEFFELHGEFDPGRVSDLTDQLLRNGSPAFNSGEVPHGMLPAMPILMDDERQLDDALDQVAAQQSLPGPAQPAVILAGNIVSGDVDRDQLNDNQELVARFIRFCTEKGIAASYYLTEYQENLPIGMVRANMHAASLDYYRQRSGRLADLLLLGMDADTRFMPTDHWVNMHRAHKESGAAAWLGGPSLRHELLGSSFPYVNSLVSWHDLGQDAGQIYPTNYGVSAGAYAEVDGILRSAAYGELNPLGRQLQESFGRGFTRAPDIGEVVASPRQLVDRITPRVGGSKVVSFGALGVGRQGYRSLLLERDITRERFAEVLPGVLQGAIAATADVVHKEIGGDLEAPLIKSVTRQRVMEELARVGDVDGLVAREFDRQFANW